ncbi:alkaline phosphatase family protein, partial [Nocardioides sp. P5_C9_2]
MSWVTGSVALVVATWVLPGLEATSYADLFAVAAVVSLFGLLARPVLASVAAAIGWLAVAAVAVAGQAVVMLLVLRVVDSVHATSFWTLVAATWIASLVSTVLTWLVSAGTDESFTTALLRYGGRGQTVADPEVDGVVFVQLDGLPYPVARWALQSGTMPTLRRWLDDGSHELREWTVQTPCTTPASQQGILQGTIDGVPAFRWYDRELGRVLVANRPADAAVIEARATSGVGLLADRGVSVSNLFSGDAERSMMTMSQVGLTRGSRDTRRTVARFVLRPDGFARSFFRTVAEVVRERFQARQQRRRDVVPRVVRPWTFALLRAITNGVLRDLNTAVVAQEMLRGTRSVYVDYVDYDEVAHHAGCNRIESLRVLQALDEVLRHLEIVARAAPRRYHFVVLSDHGQSQGPPFAERGHSLAELCATLTSADVAAMDANVESWGPVEALLEDLSGSPGTQPAARATAHRAAARGRVGEGDDLVVLGSGNLGLIYVREPKRLLLEDIDERWPALVPGLAADPGVGFVSVLS